MRVAILPAGGKGERMREHTSRPKQLLRLYTCLVIDYALVTAEKAGCWPHVILPPGKPEISFHVGYNYAWGSFSYASGPSLLDSVGLLRPIYKDRQILYIMPDTVFRPLDVGSLMLERMSETDSPAFLALFATSKPQKYGMCKLKGGYPFGYVTRIIDKPDEWPNGCGVAWGLISWTEPFWESIERTEGDNFSDVLNQAIEDLGPIPYIMLNDYIDIGTPEDFEKAVSEGW